MINTHSLRTLLVGLTLVLLCSCRSQSPEPCSSQWQAQVDAQLHTGDGQGHGPDLGSKEWQSVVTFKLGLRDHADLPTLGTHDWCVFIDRQLAARRTGP